MKTSEMTDKAEEFKQKGEEAADSLRGKAQEWQRQATTTARNAAKATDDYVRDNPWETVGWVAAGVFVLGFLLGRTSK